VANDHDDDTIYCADKGHPDQHCDWRVEATTMAMTWITDIAGQLKLYLAIEQLVTAYGEDKNLKGSTRVITTVRSHLPLPLFRVFT
jgi:hypothetical protein